MLKYHRLAKSYDEAKPLVDYARTITTFLGLAAIAALSFEKQYGAASERPNGPLFDTLFSISNGLFSLLVASLWFICGRLTYMLLLTCLCPQLLRNPASFQSPFGSRFGCSRRP
jgi:hypothetical protein